MLCVELCCVQGLEFRAQGLVPLRIGTLDALRRAPLGLGFQGSGFRVLFCEIGHACSCVELRCKGAHILIINLYTSTEVQRIHYFNIKPQQSQYIHIVKIGHYTSREPVCTVSTRIFTMAVYRLYIGFISGLGSYQDQDYIGYVVAYRLCCGFISGLGLYRLQRL